MTAPRRHWSFSLRTLFVVVAMLALPLGWVGSQWRLVNVRRALRQELDQAGATILPLDPDTWLLIEKQSRRMPPRHYFDLDQVAKREAQYQERLHLPFLRKWLGDEAVGIIDLPLPYSEPHVGPIRAAFPEADIRPFDPRAQRIRALREYADMRAENYSQARVEAIDACKPCLLLLNAEVELAETEADRITLFTGAIDDLNKLEQIAKDRAKSPRATLFSTLQIRTRRLGVEIELERAKANQAREAQKVKNQNAGATRKVADPAGKIKELQKKRIATLRECADMGAELYGKARVESIDAIEARLLLLKAEVEVAENEAERIALLKGGIDDLNKLEQIAATRIGRIAGEFYLLQIKAARLQLEIELERARANQAPADKIKELLKERIAALRDCADMAAKLCGQARLEPIDAIEARLLLLQAEGEVAGKESDRIALFKGAIDDLNKLGQIVKKYGVRTWFLQNETARLGVEIELERATAYQAPAAKGK